MRRKRKHENGKGNRVLVRKKKKGFVGMMREEVHAWVVVLIFHVDKKSL